MITKERLTSKLWQYMVANNPDLLITLQQETGITKYLQEKVGLVYGLSDNLRAEGKPPYIIEEICMNALTRELRPSKFHYLRSILEDEFEDDYERMRENGTLTYEIVNLITVCQPVFETIGFTEENEDDRNLKHAIAGTIQEYLKATI